MTTQTEAMEMALEAGFWRENINTWMCSTEDIELFAELVRAEALAEQPAQQEPVRLQCTTCGTVYADGVPPQVAQPAREPLTAKEIAEFVGTHEYGPEQLKWFRLGEAAHGIKENT